MGAMKILFLTHTYPNYVPDLLLHGLRKLLGPAVVDYPRKDCLYQGVLGLGVCPPNQLCPGWFPADEGTIDRGDIPAKIAGGHFDCIVVDVRALGSWMPLVENSRSPIAIIDGEDRPASIRPGRYVVFRRETDGVDYSIPLPMALPEEIFHWIVSYDDQPKTYSIGFLGSTHDGERLRFIEELSACYPNCLFSASVVPSAQNPLPRGRYGRDEYYRELQKCRLVLSLAGAGNDTFRFWEHAACNAVHLSVRSPLFIPDDFEDGRSILRFSDSGEIRAHIDRVLEKPDLAQELVIEARLHLIQHHLTIHRAGYFLNRLQVAFGSLQPPSHGRLHVRA
jgi:hypothetical protein